MANYGEIRDQIRLLVDPLLIRFKEELYGSGVSFGRIQPAALPPTTIYTTNLGDEADNLGYIKGITTYSGGTLKGSDQESLSFIGPDVTVVGDLTTIDITTPLSVKITNPMIDEGDYIIGAAAVYGDKALGIVGTTAASTFAGSLSDITDGNDATAWLSATTATASVTIDLGVSIPIDSFRVLQYSTGHRRTFTIESSIDNVSFVTRFTSASFPSVDSGTTSLTTPATARYWRLNLLTPSFTGGFGGGLNTFSLFGGFPAGVPQRAPGGGTTGARPGSPVLYQRYFDTTLAKPYWWDGANWVTITVPSGGGAGSVTSVGLSLPSLFSVSNSPITGSGVITATLVTQNAGVFFAGPASGIAAVPNFRTLALADIPSLTSLYQPVDNDLTALAALSSSGIAVRTATDTWALRTLTGTANRITMTNGNGVSGNPVIDIAATYSGQTTITNVGTVTAGTWQAGIISPIYGGTGVNNGSNTLIIPTAGTAALLDTANVFTQAQSIIVPSANTNNQANGLVVALRSSATPVAGFGVLLRYQLQSSTTVDQDAGAIAARWSDATHATRTSYLAFYTALNGALAEKMHLTGEGYLGIGTTVPETFLQLHSTSVATLMRLSSFAPGIEWENNVVAASRTMFAFIGLGTSAGHYGQAAGDFNIGVGSSGAGNSNNLNFLTATNDSGGYARRAMITKAGLFGIGATAPTTAFEIQTGVVTAGLYQVDTLGATEVEILPAGTISYTLVIISILCRDSAAALNNGANARLDVPASTSVTYGIAVGTNTVTVRLYSTGRLTIQRTAGSGTIKVSIIYNGL